MNFFETFSKRQFRFDVRFVRLFFHTEMLFLQLRPQLRHCTEQDQDFHKPTCLTVSFPAATATERILDFDASRCER